METRTRFLQLCHVLFGLFQITAGCATLEPWAALVVGLFAGALYLLASDLLIKFKIDDAGMYFCYCSVFLYRILCVH